MDEDQLIDSPALLSPSSAQSRGQILLLRRGRAADDRYTQPLAIGAHAVVLTHEFARGLLVRKLELDHDVLISRTRGDLGALDRRARKGGLTSAHLAPKSARGDLSAATYLDISACRARSQMLDADPSTSGASNRNRLVPPISVTAIVAIPPQVSERVGRKRSALVAVASPRPRSASAPCRLSSGEQLLPRIPDAIAT